MQAGHARWLGEKNHVVAQYPVTSSPSLCHVTVLTGSAHRPLSFSLCAACPAPVTIASLMTGRRIRDNIAVTGEVTLSGPVNPISHLQVRPSKTTAAWVRL